MADCTSIDSLVTPYLDGELSAADRGRVDDHARRCSRCQSRLAAEAAVRDLVRGQRAALAGEAASPALRAACRALTGAGRSPLPVGTGREPAQRLPAGAASWRRRVPIGPIALAASLALLVGAAFYEATDRSPRLLAAELAADHVKCFRLDELLGTHQSRVVVERSMIAEFDWHVNLSGDLDRAGLELVGARPCLYAEGRVAHLMYRHEGRPVSIFMLPRKTRDEEMVDILGHEAAIWSVDDRTFVLIERASRAEVQHMASIVKAVFR